MFGSSIASSRQLILCALALFLCRATGQTLTLENFGAVGDGVTDDTVALNSAFAQAPPGSTILIPAGRTYAHNNIIKIGVPDLKITGGGRLLATNEGGSGVWISADRVVVDNIVLELKSTTKRWMAYEQMKLRLMNSRGVVVRGVTIEGAAAAGIFVGNCVDFTIDRVVVRNTRASGIYITEGSSSGNILRPQVLNSGGDGVAFLSQKSHAVQVSKMFLQSPRVMSCPSGRAFSVVGGRDIIMNDIYAEDTDAAALYIAAEPSINSYGVSNVKVNGGVLIRSNQNQAIGHGSIMVYNGQPYDVIENISVNNIRAENTKNSQPWEMGIIMTGSGGVKRIELRDIIAVGGPSLVLNAQNDLSMLRTERIVQDGRRLADKVGYSVEWTSAPSYAPTRPPVPVSRAGRQLYVRRGARE
ncbi:polygalacturonase [Fragilaria crotonensis]|nr:polygalacturonase [Fragilaria crotonensis]